MQAQSFKHNRHPAAVARHHCRFSDQQPNLAHHLFRIRQYGGWLGPWDQGAVRPVPPVGEGFGRERMVERSGSPLHRRPGAPHQPKRRIEPPDRVNDRHRQGVVGLSLVVQRAMRFDVVEDGSLSPSNRIERAQLVEEQVADFRRGQQNNPPAEPLAVIETGVRAYGDTMMDGGRDGGPHRVRVAGMQTAGDIRRGDHPEQRLLRLPLALAYIRI